MSDGPASVVPFLRSNLFGGEGEVRVHDLLAGEVQGPFTAVLWCSLSPGGSVGAHHQEHHPEVVVGIAGRGEARVDGAVHPMEVGTVVYLPLGASLALRNLSRTEAFQYLIVKAQGA